MSVETIRPFAIAASRARHALLPIWLRRTLKQVLFITPLFWFMELLQNYGYKLATGDWGWRYCDSVGQLTEARRSYDWHSLLSLLPWAFTVIVFSALEPVFARHRVPFLLRMIVAGTIGFAGEYSVGYLGANFFHLYLQIWNHAPLTYISLSALPIWCLDFWVFHLLTQELRSAHEGRSGARQ